MPDDGKNNYDNKVTAGSAVTSAFSDIIGNSYKSIEKDLGRPLYSTPSDSEGILRDISQKTKDTSSITPPKANPIPQIVQKAVIKDAVPKLEKDDYEQKLDSKISSTSALDKINSWDNASSFSPSSRSVSQEEKEKVDKTPETEKTKSLQQLEDEGKDNALTDAERALKSIDDLGRVGDAKKIQRSTKKTTKSTSKGYSAGATGGDFGSDTGDSEDSGSQQRTSSPQPRLIRRDVSNYRPEGLSSIPRDSSSSSSFGETGNQSSSAADLPKQTYKSPTEEPIPAPPAMAPQIAPSAPLMPKQYKGEDDSDITKTDADQTALPTPSVAGEKKESWAKRIFSKIPLIGKFKWGMRIAGIVVLLLTLFICMIAGPGSDSSRKSALMEVIGDAIGNSSSSPLDFFEKFKVEGIVPTFVMDNVGNISSMQFRYTIKLKDQAKYNKDIGREKSNEIKVESIELRTVINSLDQQIVLTPSASQALYSTWNIESNGKAVTWTPSEMCENGNCNTNEYVVDIKYDFSAPVAKQELARFEVILGGNASYTLNGVKSSTSESEITPAYVLCVNADQSSDKRTVQNQCSLKSTENTPNDPGLSLGSDFICPALIDKLAEEKVVRTQKFISQGGTVHGGNDLVPYDKERRRPLTDENLVVAPIAGVIVYKLSSAEAKYCGDAVMIRSCKQWDNENSPTQCLEDGDDVYWVGHFQDDEGKWTDQQSQSSNGGRFIIKQNEVLGQYFNPNLPPNSTCVITLPNGETKNIPCYTFSSGLLCWTGAHIHVEHRKSSCLGKGCSLSDIDQIVQDKCEPID